MNGWIVAHAHAAAQYTSDQGACNDQLALQVIGAVFAAVLAHVVAFRVARNHPEAHCVALLVSGPAFVAVLYLVRDLTCS